MLVPRVTPSRAWWEARCPNVGFTARRANGREVKVPGCVRGGRGVRPYEVDGFPDKS